MAFQLPVPVQNALTCLTRQGYAAYVVGGCVRDLLRGVTPHDYDLCTSAFPAQIQACFASCRQMTIGLAHGTIGVWMDKLWLEITTFRVDGSYSDGRHPDQVRFTGSLAEDLGRRDFTINAMAYHPSLGVQDFYGGVEDLHGRKIRCVGEARRRFEEDALRILRALRFAAVMGFTVEPETMEAMERERMGLQKVSVERVASECNRLLMGQDAARVLRDFPSCVTAAIPEWEDLVNRADWQQRTAALSFAPPVLEIRWAALLEGGDASVLRRLRMSNAQCARVQALLEATSMPLETDWRGIRKGLARLGAVGYAQWLSLTEAMAQAQGAVERVEMVRTAQNVCAQMMQQGDCYGLSQLEITGHDLIAAGYPSGPAIGRALEKLLQAVMGEELPNQKASLRAA
ncbi:MAG: tRNA nucleotidyltransferase, partial [Clostridia bacterium]